MQILGTAYIFRLAESLRNPGQIGIIIPDSTVFHPGLKILQILEYAPENLDQCRCLPQCHQGYFVSGRRSQATSSNIGRQQSNSDSAITIHLNRADRRRF
jgi:hypothetical protein